MGRSRDEDTGHVEKHANRDQSGLPTSSDPGNPVGGAVADEEAGGEAVVRSTLTMSIATLLSRFTGFARTWACAFALGNTLLSSSYQIANNVPNMLYELVAGGILSTAFLPVYMTLLEQRGRRKAGLFASNLMSIAIIVLGLISLLGSIFSPQVIATQTFMSGSEESELAIYLFRFLSFEVIFYGVGAVLSGILNAHKSFLWPALAPVFNNIVVVATMVGFVLISPHNVEIAKIWLAMGTVLGVAAMLGVQIPALIKLKIPFRLHIDLRDPALKETLRIAGPAMAFIVFNLVVVSVRNAFSMGVSDNGPSTLSYAWMWYQFPYGVLAVALSTAMLTEMSAASANEDWSLFRKNVEQGLSGTLFLIIPLACLMLVLAQPLTAIYRAGAFTAEDVDLVAQVLRAWCLSLPLYAGYMYLYRTFSAMKSLAKITWIDACGRVVQAAMYALFTMGVGSWEGMGLVGIPIADTIFYGIMFFVMAVMLRRKVGAYGFGRILGSAVRALVASVAGGIVTMWLCSMFGSSYDIIHALLTVIACGAVGLAIFYALARLFRVPETSLIDGMMGRILGKLRLKRG